MQNHSTATHTTTASTFRPRVRRLGPGRYLVESQTKPGTGHSVTVDHCNCKGFFYRGACCHVALVRALEPSMAAWYGQATPPPAPVVVPMSAGAPSGIKRPVMGQPVYRLDDAVEQAERQLDAALRALADTDRQADEYAVYLHEVDVLERQVAAAHYAHMRSA